MVKKLIAVAVIFCSGCSFQDDAELKAFVELCKNNGGIDFLMARPFAPDVLVCKNKAEFTEHAWGSSIRAANKDAEQ